MKKLLIIVLICSCRTAITSEELDTKGWNEYSNESIGWTIRYPSDYSIMSSEEIRFIESGGQNALEESSELEIEKNYKNLLWLKDGGMNGLTSILQDNSSLSESEIKNSEEAADSLMIESIRSQGIQFNYSFGFEEFSGLRFKTLEANYYSPNGTKFMTQKSFDHYFSNRQVLSITINYTADSCGIELDQIVRTSTFKN